MTKHCRQDSGQNEVFLMNVEARILDLWQCQKLISSPPIPNVTVLKSTFFILISITFS